MPATLHRLEVPVVLLALVLAAGCGSQPPAAPEDGPMAPPEGSGIAWGAPENGLQAGLIALGGAPEAFEWWWWSWACPACRGGFSGRDSCDLCGAKLRGHAVHCLSCTANRRICSGCMSARPSADSFGDTETLFLELHLFHGGREPLNLPGWHDEIGRIDPQAVRVEFAGLNGGPTWVLEGDPLLPAVSDRCAPPVSPLVLSAGQGSMEVLASSPTHRFSASGREPVRFLPAGRYRVTFVYEHALATRAESGPLWHGRAVSAPSELEVRPRPPAAPREVAWGPPVDGLQIGLVADGGWREYASRRTADLLDAAAGCAGSGDGAGLVLALSEASDRSLDLDLKAWLEAVRAEVEGGATLAEALEKRMGVHNGSALAGVLASTGAEGKLPAALSALAEYYREVARPRSSCSGEEAIFFTVHVRNVRAVPLVLRDSALRYCVRPRFVRLDGPVGQSFTAWETDPKDRIVVAPLVIAPGATISFGAGTGRGFLEESSAAKRPAVSLRTLPPGRYAVTMGYEECGRTGTEAEAFWHGKVASGAVKIEARPALPAAGG